MPKTFRAVLTTLEMVKKSAPGYLKKKIETHTGMQL
jgi:hypothetical protein